MLLEVLGKNFKGDRISVMRKMLSLLCALKFIGAMYDTLGTEHTMIVEN